MLSIIFHALRARRVRRNAAAVRRAVGYAREITGAHTVELWRAAASERTTPVEDRSEPSSAHTTRNARHDASAYRLTRTQSTRIADAYAVWLASARGSKGRDRGVRLVFGSSIRSTAPSRPAPACAVAKSQPAHTTLQKTERARLL